MSHGISPNGLPCVIILLRVGHHAVTERRKTGTASGLVEVESHDFNRGSVSIEEIYNYKATPEIQKLVDFKEFEKWYDIHRKRISAKATDNAAKKAA